MHFLILWSWIILLGTCIKKLTTMPRARQLAECSRGSAEPPLQCLLPRPARGQLCFLPLQQSTMHAPSQSSWWPSTVRLVCLFPLMCLEFSSEALLKSHVTTICTSPVLTWFHLTSPKYESYSFIFPFYNFETEATGGKKVDSLKVT
jgi:hypothetical protein